MTIYITYDYKIKSNNLVEITMEILNTFNRYIHERHKLIEKVHVLLYHDLEVNVKIKLVHCLYCSSLGLKGVFVVC